jgi:hypothetical protein
MKRIAIITATLGLLFAAVPAVATPTSTFTVSANGLQISATSTSVCRYKPCTNQWKVDGKALPYYNTTGHMAMTVAAGCHTIGHTITERALRNPTPLSHSSAQVVCV